MSAPAQESLDQHMFDSAQAHKPGGIWLHAGVYSVNVCHGGRDVAVLVFEAGRECDDEPLLHVISNLPDDARDATPAAITSNGIQRIADGYALRELDSETGAQVILPFNGFVLGVRDTDRGLLVGACDSKLEPLPVRVIGEFGAWIEVPHGTMPSVSDRHLSQQALLKKRAGPDGRVAVFVWGRDCDMVESTDLHWIPATPRAFRTLKDEVEASAEGPTRLKIVSTTEARNFQAHTRDLVMEAYENGRTYDVTPEDDMGQAASMRM